VAVLGGDVFFKQGDKVELAYANWYANKAVDETFFAYVERSCLAALDYITGFRGRKNAIALFTLVLQSNDGSFHSETTER
jgi:hypothetical protein